MRRAFYEHAEIWTIKGVIMSNKPEALLLASILDDFAAKSERAPLEMYDSISSELRRLHAENERLNNALQWEQNRFERIGTHGPGCHTWGHRHYECLLREYKSLLDALEVEERAQHPPGL